MKIEKTPSAIIVETGGIGFEILISGRTFEKIPEIIEAYFTTGEYSIFAKIICKNTEHLREVINDKMQPINGISRTETIISLGESIKKQVPIDV